MELVPVDRLERWLCRSAGTIFDQLSQTWTSAPKTLFRVDACIVSLFSPPGHVIKPTLTWADAPCDASLSARESDHIVCGCGTSVCISKMLMHEGREPVFRDSTNTSNFGKRARDHHMIGEFADEFTKHILPNRTAPNC